MEAEQATAMELVRNRRLEKSLKTGALVHLRIARNTKGNSLHHLADLAAALLKETETLANNKEFADQSSRLALNISEGIDFYAELERFEAFMIVLALEETRGHQARAARLLHMNPTTLNTKIKRYGIEY
jgi:transcriptional regulator with GAF, ATPase, and Fis domain